MHVLVERKYRSVWRLPTPCPLPDEQTVQRFLGNAQPVPDPPETRGRNNFAHGKTWELAPLQDQDRDTCVSQDRRRNRARGTSLNYDPGLGRPTRTALD